LLIQDNGDSGVKKEQLTVKMIYQKNISRSYGLLPKMRRLEVLHKYLFYLTRGYQGKIREGSTIDGEFLMQTHQSDKGEPTMYSPEQDWRRFLPPIPVHPGEFAVYQGC
jgi:hypothetical protein